MECTPRIRGFILKPYLHVQNISVDIKPVIGGIEAFCDWGKEIIPELG